MSKLVRLGRLVIISVHPLRTDLRRPSCLVISCHCPLLSSNRKGPLLVHHSLFQQLLSQHHRCIHSLTCPLLVLGSNVPSLPRTVVCLKEKPKKSLSLIIPNQKTEFERLDNPKLNRLGGKSVLSQEERDCRRFKGCGNHVFRPAS